MAKVSTEKKKVLAALLKIYKDEIDAIYGIAITWNKLTDKAKDKCIEDFDQAIIARETFLDEIIMVKIKDDIIEDFEDNLSNIDKKLLKYNKVVKELYQFDSKTYLNAKLPKSYLK